MLTHKVIDRALPAEKPYSLLDHDRLYIEVLPSGTKSWRFKYLYNRKRDRLTFGRYPEVSLSRAREMAVEARQMLQRGIDPSPRFRQWRQQSRTVKNNAQVAQPMLFKEVVDEYYELKRGQITDKHIERVKRLFRTHLYPTVGDTHINNIQPLDLLGPLQNVDQYHSTDIANRLLNWSRHVFRYAIATQRITTNPAEALVGSLRPTPQNHLAAVTEPDKLGKLLLDISKLGTDTSARVALQLMPKLFVRPGELRQAVWSEFDVEAILAGKPSVWSIPAERMKMKNPHLVPLSQQATDLLRYQHQQSGHLELVFPTRARNKDKKITPISDNAMTVTLRNLGWNRQIVTVHGFRATARTLLDEVLKYPPAIIEHQLAHVVRDPLGRAYNRTTYLDERIVMMQKWSDYLDGLVKKATETDF